MIVITNKKRFYGFVVALALILIIALGFILHRPIMRLSYPYKYETLVNTNAKRYGIDPFLLLSVMKAESNFKPDASSRKDAKGLMQITDQTAAWSAQQMGLEDFVPSSIYQPEQNINIGSWYLAKLLKDNDGYLINTLAAYNAGEGNVQKWLTLHEKNQLALEDIPYGETRKYISKTLSNYHAYQKLWAQSNKVQNAQE